MKLRNPLARTSEPADPPATVVPLFAADQPLPADLKQKIRSPIVAGMAVIVICVVGLFTWAAASSVTGGVVAPGVVRAEANLKTLKAIAPSVVERIYVRDGQRVARGEVLIVFDPTRAKAELDVLRSSYHNLLAERARYSAELRGANVITFPLELTAQAGDPAVAAMLRTQNDVFQSRRILVNSQQEILGQRLQQLNSRITGLQAQVSSLDEQERLINEELAGVRELNAKGYAPLNRVRALERNAASLGGNKGGQVAEISRARESIGEARLELAKVRQQQVTEAAEKLREVETRIADLLPRLTAAEQAFAQTKVIAPVDGYVLNLTQFTEGGVAGAGETLLDIVPSNAPMVIDAKVRPQDIDQVAPGMKARIRLSAYSQRLSPEVEAEVTTVSADRLVDERTGESYFRAELRVPASEMRKFAGKKVKMNPGMPADTMIVTGERSVLDFIVGPLRDTIGDSLREE